MPKLWTPEQLAEVEARVISPPEREPAPKRPAPSARRKRQTIPRCRCGCGKAAKWPLEGPPLFYSREHGYLMMVEIVRKREARKKGG